MTKRIPLSGDEVEADLLVFREHEDNNFVPETLAEAGIASTTDLTTHAAAADPHTGYRLESADHSHASTGLQAGTIDHGVITGLSDDDHPQYLKETDFDDIDFLVGQATGHTAAEIVVGTTPGGELGGSWGTPTVDANHGGGTHAATQAAAEATAAAALAGHTGDVADAHDASAISVVSTTLVGTGTDAQAVFEELDNAIVAAEGALTTHAAAADPHAGYVKENDANWTDLTDSGATTLHSHAGGSAVFYQVTYDASDTWTKADYTNAVYALIENWGGGGGGGRGSSGNAGGGGGGGGYKWLYKLISALGTTEAVTVGGGGAAQAADAAGNVGSSTTFGAWLTAFGGAGGAGAANGGGGGGGGASAVGTVGGADGGAGGTPVGGIGGVTAAGGESGLGGGGGGDGGTPFVGGASIEGGGGGGGGGFAAGAGGAGGASNRGGGGGGGASDTGTGGAGGASGGGGAGGAGGGNGGAAVAGVQPGGGGGGSEASNNSGKGGDGRIRVTMWG